MFNTLNYNYCPTETYKLKRTTRAISYDAFSELKHSSIKKKNCLISRWPLQFIYH